VPGPSQPGSKHTSGRTGTDHNDRRLTRAAALQRTTDPTPIFEVSLASGRGRRMVPMSTFIPGRSG